MFIVSSPFAVSTSLSYHYIVTKTLAYHNFCVHWIQYSGSAMFWCPRNFYWEPLTLCWSTETILEIYIEAEVHLTRVKEEDEVVSIFIIYNDVSTKVNCEVT